MLKWADGKAVKDQLDAELIATIGPKDERDAPQKTKVETNSIFYMPMDTVVHNHGF